MFARIVKAKGHQYLQVLESYREEGRAKHRVLANLGNVEALVGSPGLVGLAEKLLEIAGAPSLRAEDLVETARLGYGHVAYQKLWRRLGIDKLLAGAARGRRIRFDLGAAVFLMTADRLLSPRSKLACHGAQGSYTGLGPEVDLNHLYRALDVLAEEKENLEEALFAAQRDLFNARVSVALYDVTTFHFESVRADGLRDFGFSKACKFNEVQVVLGLLTDEAGRPVGYDLFPGNTFDGKTLLTALDKLKKRFEIKEVIIAADAGINSAENLLAIERAGYRFVVATPLRKAPAEVKNAALDPEGYHEVPGGEPGEALRIKTIEGRTRIITGKDESGARTQTPLATRVVCTWSSKRAEKDRRDRDRLVEKACAIEEKTPMDDRRGHRRYVKTDGATRAAGLHTARIEADAQWDGYHAIETNDTTLASAQLLDVYRQLWRIEQSFRIMKTTLETRPIFHWTPRRIHGHFVLCFLAFLLERTLEITLREKEIDASPDAIARALRSLEVSRLEVRGEAYYLKGSAEPLAHKILRALSIAPLKNLTPAADFQLQ